MIDACLTALHWILCAKLLSDRELSHSLSLTFVYSFGRYQTFVKIYTFHSMILRLMSIRDRFLYSLIRSQE